MLYLISKTGYACIDFIWMYAEIADEILCMMFKLDIEIEIHLQIYNSCLFFTVFMKFNIFCLNPDLLACLQYCLSICMSVCVYARLSVYLFVCLSVVLLVKKKVSPSVDWIFRKYYILQWINMLVINLSYHYI